MSARQTTLVPDSFTERQLRETHKIEKLLISKADIEEQAYFLEKRKKGPPMVLFPTGNVGTSCINALTGEKLPFSCGSLASKLAFQVTDSRGKHFNYGNPVAFYFRHPDDYYMYFYGRGKDRYNEAAYEIWESRYNETMKTLQDRSRISRNLRRN